MEANKKCIYIMVNQEDFDNLFMPILNKNKITITEAITKLINYAIVNPVILNKYGNDLTVARYVDYITANEDKEILTKDLRNLKIVNGNKFKDFWYSNLPLIQEKLNKRGYILNIIKGKGNKQIYICKQSTIRFNINQSLSNLFKISKVDRFIEYFINNENKLISRSDLRNLKIVNANKFKDFWNKNINTIKERLAENGYLLFDIKGKKNNTYIKIRKIISGQQVIDYDW